MPYDHFRNMTEDDLVALYTYLSTLATTQPRVDAGNTINDKVTQGIAIWCDDTHACPTLPQGAGTFTCHKDATIGNECTGNACASDEDCGACQTCNTGTHVCEAPSDQAHIACALGAGI
jgi:hypothetical protein